MTRSTLLIVVLLSASLFATAQTAEKTMLKSFNLDGKSQLSLVLPGNVETREWDKSTVQIQITVSLPNSNAGMLNELANVGRYNLTLQPDGDKMTVTSPNLHKVIKIKGVELKEVINFLVFVPKGLDIKVIDPALAAADAMIVLKN